MKVWVFMWFFWLEKLCAFASLKSSARFWDLTLTKSCTLMSALSKHAKSSSLWAFKKSNFRFFGISSSIAPSAVRGKALLDGAFTLSCVMSRVEAGIPAEFKGLEFLAEFVEMGFSVEFVGLGILAEFKGLEILAEFTKV